MAFLGTYSYSVCVMDVCVCVYTMYDTVVPGTVQYQYGKVVHHPLDAKTVCVCCPYQNWCALTKMSTVTEESEDKHSDHKFCEQIPKLPALGVEIVALSHSKMKMALFIWSNPFALPKKRLGLS
jgi:hypothetical protein